MVTLKNAKKYPLARFLLINILYSNLEYYSNTNILNSLYGGEFDSILRWVIFKI